MTYRLRNIGIAVVLAVMAALLTIFYVTNYKKNVQQGEDLVPVWVAVREIPVGTSGAEARDRNLFRADKIAQRSVVPGAITKPDQVEQLVATERIYQGEQISLNRFHPLGEQGIKAQLKGRLRALDVAGNEHQLLMGKVEAGDHIDFVGSLEIGNGVHVTKVVVRDLLVLEPPAQGAVESKLGARPDEAFSATLAATDQQAQKLFHVMTHGDWSFALRPVTDAADSRDSSETSASVMRRGAGRRGR